MDLSNKLQLKSIQAFEAASRLLSFKEASEELKITPSAVTYRISQLEDLLGVKLFERGNRTVYLTGAGRVYARYCKSGMEQFSGIAEVLSSKVGRRQLHVHVGTSLANTWLMQRLPVFFTEYPDIALNLSDAEMYWAWPEDGVAAELRPYSRDFPDGELYSLPLFREYAMPVMSEALLSRHGAEADSKLLQKSVLLHDMSENRVGMSTWPVWLEAAGYRRVDPQRGIRFALAEMPLAAAENHCGIALARTTFAIRGLQEGRLVAPYKTVVRLDGVFRFRCHRNRLGDTRVRAFRDWLQQQALEHDELVAKFLKGRRIVDGRSGSAIAKDPGRRPQEGSGERSLATDRTISSLARKW